MLNPATQNFLDSVENFVGRPSGGDLTAAVFQVLEDRLGVSFPEAYKAFVSVYGPGSLCNDIDIYHPTVDYPPYGLLGDIIDAGIRNWQEDPYFWDEAIQGGAAPFELGTEPGMLLPWGDALNQVTLYFRISDDGEWEVIEYSEGFHERSGLHFDEWILRYLSGGGSSGYFVTAKQRSGPPFFRPAGDFR